MRKPFVSAVFLLSTWLQPEALWAQSPAPIGGRIELAVGGGWIGPVTFSTPAATEPDHDGEPFRLFTTRGEMGATVAYEARFSVRVTEVFEVETGASYAAPDLIVRLSADVEDAESIEVRETVNQIRVGGGLVANLRRPESGRRNVPFLMAGAGYLRDLHQGQTLAVNGQEYFMGGGLKLTLRSSPGSRVKAVGVRLDARVVLRIKGVALDDQAHFMPVAGGSLFFRF